MPEVRHLVQLSDCHLLADVDGERRGVRPHPRLAHVAQRLAHAQQEGFGIDAILLTGDLIDEDPAAYDHVVELLAPLQVPLWPALGNHDDPDAMREVFAPYVSLHLKTAKDAHTRIHQFDNLEIVFLNTSQPPEVDLHVDEDALQWVLRHVDKARPQLLVTHHPPGTTGVEWIDAHQPGAGAFDAFLRTLSPQLCVFGHVHCAMTLPISGTTAVACPSTAWSFGEERALAKCHQATPAGLHLMVDDNATVRSRVLHFPLDEQRHA